jgi:hypothetical protein
MKQRLIGAIFAASALASCGSIGPTPTALVPTPIATLAPSAQASATPSPPISPSPSLTIGQVVDGIPTSINGRPVYLLADARPLMLASTRDVPLLVGGWFHSPGPVFFCPLNGETPPWGPCLRLFIYSSPRGQLSDLLGPVWQYGKAPDLAFAIYPGDPPVTDARTAYASTRPVVLSVHTHDPACTKGLVILASPCSSMLVMDALVWLGQPIT